MTEKESNLPKGITSLTGFVRKISSLRSASPSQTLLFRGHSKSTYEFKPSVLRTENWRKSEHLMIRQLLANSPEEFAKDRSAFDILVRAQHYGLPTRLLDVSTNPLVALYFACCTRPKDRAQVLAIKPPIKEQKYFDSDTISLLCHLSYLTRGEKDALLEYARDNINSDDKNARIKQFAKCPELDKLLQSVRNEKPHFRAEVDPYDLAFVVSVTPRQSHQRIRAQNGAFLVFGMTEGTKGGHVEEIEKDFIDIPPSSKQIILKELSSLGLSRRTLFPEIENAAEEISRDYS